MGKVENKKEERMDIKEYARQVIAITGGELVSENRNGVELCGITKRKKGEWAGRIFWMNGFMEEEKTPEWTAGYITAVERKATEPPFERIDIENKEEAVKHLRARLRHVDNAPEICRSAEDYGFYDLVIEPYLLIRMKDRGFGAAQIKEGLLDIWKMSPKEVIDRAIANSEKDACIVPMSEQLGEMLDELWDMPRMMVVTTKQGFNGAVAALFMDRQLKEYFGSGYTLFPSSIHEMIAVNRKGEGLEGIVKEVNEKEVSPLDRLSDHAYHMW